MYPWKPEESVGLIIIQVITYMYVLITFLFRYLIKKVCPYLWSLLTNQVKCLPEVLFGGKDSLPNFSCICLLRSINAWLNDYKEKKKTRNKQKSIENLQILTLRSFLAEIPSSNNWQFLTVQFPLQIITWSDICHARVNIAKYG